MIDIAGEHPLNLLPMHDCSIGDTPIRNQLITSFGTAAVHSTKASGCFTNLIGKDNTLEGCW